MIIPKTFTNTKTLKFENQKLKTKTENPKIENWKLKSKNWSCSHLLQQIVLIGKLKHDF